MPLWQVVLLAVVQGLTELLPVSSSAHVIVTAKLLHQDMSTPSNALLLVLLHTGTMFAVIAYFWNRWVDEFFSSLARFWQFVKLVFVATLLSGIVGYPLSIIIGRVLGHGGQRAEIEVLFNKLTWIAPALAAAGLLILYAGLHEARRQETAAQTPPQPIRWVDAVVMGILQGFAIPFRGFSRSGSTISGGLLTGGKRAAIESFSFAMAVAVTPLAIGREAWRVFRTVHTAGVAAPWSGALTPGLFGMVCAFAAGLIALRWLSNWLEQGRWHWFGIYCLAVAIVLGWLAHVGY
ncbi:MAG TPA: undecaprenyl-diphosphate phosphatase [Candidatus Limnocylindrales bacterium]|nr:undecaprenyl-diphosphate phosphatase [Candidatus Limnocylindrales bacterium]